MTDPHPSNIDTGTTISWPTASAITVANMVGTGVFTCLGFQVLEITSGFSLIMLWAIGGLCALCGALSYAELGTAFPRSGGEYNFLGRVYGPAVGFLGGWISLTVGFTAPIAMAGMAFGEYLHSGASWVHPLTASCAVVALVTSIHLIDIRRGSWFQNTFTGLKLSLIFFFVFSGFFFHEPGHEFQFLPAASDLSILISGPFAVSLVYVMYAYSGWNASTYIISEIRHPGRNIPLSLSLATLLVSGLYVALNWMFLYTTPLPALKGQLDVGSVVAAEVYGDQGGRLMSLMIAVLLVSSISSMVWVGPRVSMVMGEDHGILRFLARKSRRGIPRVAMLFQSTIVIVLLLTSTFDRILVYAEFSLILSNFLTVLGVIVHRFRTPRAERPFGVWGYPATPALFLGVHAFILVHVAIERPQESVLGFATILGGLAVYTVSKRWFPIRKPDESTIT